MEEYISKSELHRCLPGAEDGLDNTQCLRNIVPYAVGGMLCKQQYPLAICYRKLVCLFIFRNLYKFHDHSIGSFVVPFITQLYAQFPSCHAAYT